MAIVSTSRMGTFLVILISYLPHHKELVEGTHEEGGYAKLLAESRGQAED